MPASSEIYSMPAMEKAVFTLTAGSLGAGSIQDVGDFNPDTFIEINAVGGDCTIDIDCGAAFAINRVAIWVHNYNTDHNDQYGSAPVPTVAIYSDNNDNGSYSATTIFDQIGYWPATTGVPLYWLTDNQTARTKRYWRLMIKDMDTDVEISGIWLCHRHNITVGNQYPEQSPHRYYNQVVNAPGGRRFVSRVTKREIKTFSRIFMLNGSTVYAELLEAFQNSAGSALPMILVEGSNNYFVRLLDDEFDENVRQYQQYNPTLRFQTIPYIEDGEAY